MTMVTAPSVLGFTQTGPANLSVNFKNMAQQAGFVNATDHPSGAFDITPPGWDGVAEDRPRWGAPSTGQNNPLNIWLLKGPGVIQGAQWPDSVSAFGPTPGATDEVKVYLNGVTGTWWVAFNNVLQGIGTRIRRLPMDLHEGVFPRFCIVQKPPYGSHYNFLAFTSGGKITGGSGLFSPIFQSGSGDPPFCVRNPGTMPPTIAPLFPLWGQLMALPPVYLGEFMDVMVATDGFATLAEPMPGWMVLEGAGPGPWFVVPKPPAGFVSL